MPLEKRVSPAFGRLACTMVMSVALLGACGEKPAPPVADPAPAAAVAETPPPSPAPMPPPPPEPTDEVLATQTAKRIADLNAIKAALERYATDHQGKFPVSNGFQGYQSQWGGSLGPNWIPELVPNYIADLPRDPSGAEFSNGPMYLYTSDGSGYKLLAHGIPKCATTLLTDGVAIDPSRSSGPTDCWAYGVWSAGSEKL